MRAPPRALMRLEVGMSGFSHSLNAVSIASRAYCLFSFQAEVTGVASVARFGTAARAANEP